MRSNCILFALSLYRRRRKRGREGYLLIRKSRLGWYCHVLYAEVRPGGRLRIVSFKPNNGKPLICPPPCFKGHGAWGDN